tara:strand:- start:20265 stop:20393 length:129 start_codon:yes stop_codon:yes gene_type:complete
VISNFAKSTLETIRDVVKLLAPPSIDADQDHSTVKEAFDRES